jgi:hypothetical protein
MPALSIAFDDYGLNFDLHLGRRWHIRRCFWIWLDLFLIFSFFGPVIWMPSILDFDSKPAQRTQLEGHEHWNSSI